MSAWVRTPQLLHISQQCVEFRHPKVLSWHWHARHSFYTSHKCVEFRHPKVMSYDMSGRRHNHETLSTRSSAMSTSSTRSLAAFFPRFAICRFPPPLRSSFQRRSIILTQAGDVYKCVLVQRTLFNSCSVCACHSQLTATCTMCKRQPRACKKKNQKKMCRISNSTV